MILGIEKNLYIFYILRKMNYMIYEIYSLQFLAISILSCEFIAFVAYKKRLRSKAKVIKFLQI